MEKDEFKKILTLYRGLSSFYFVLWILSYIPMAAVLQGLLDTWKGTLSFDEIKTRIPILIAASLFFAAAALILRSVLVKKSSRNMSKSPYTAMIGLNREEDVLSLLNEKIGLEKVCDDCSYGIEKGSKNIRLFVLSFKNPDHDNDLQLAEDVIVGLNEQLLPKRVSMDMHHKIGRVQLFIYDKVPDNVMNAAVANVEDYIKQFEPCANVFISTDEGAIYIPQCCSQEIGIAKLYLYLVERVEDWFDL